jgi:hypothetical protein
MITQFVPVNEFLTDEWVLGCAGDSGGDLHQGYVSFRWNGSSCIEIAWASADY